MKKQSVRKPSAANATKVESVRRLAEAAGLEFNRMMDGNTWKQDGPYYVKLKNATGCDADYLWKLLPLKHVTAEMMADAAKRLRGPKF